MLIDPHVTALGGRHAGGSQVQSGGVGQPADRNDRQGRLDAVDHVVLLEDHPHPGGCFLESADAAEVLPHLDARGSERRRHGPGDILVLGGEDPRTRLKQRHPGAELGEDGRDLGAGRPGADHQQRLRHGGQRPGVAVRARQLRTRYRQRPVHAARTENNLVRVNPDALLGFDGVRVDEPGGPRVLGQDHTRVLQLGTRDRMLADLGDHLAHPLEQPPIVQSGVAHLDAVPVQVPRLPAQPGGLRQRAYRNGTVRGGHPAHRIPGKQRCPRAQPRRPQRREDPGRPTADDRDVGTYLDHNDLAPCRGRWTGPTTRGSAPSARCTTIGSAPSHKTIRKGTTLGRWEPSGARPPLRGDDAGRAVYDTRRPS